MERVDTDNGRFYRLEDGRMFPSVTTVLSKATHKGSLEKWRKAVGEDKANRVTTQATTRGKQLHSLLEDYVMNVPDYDQNVMPSALENFLRIQANLDSSLTAVYKSEFPLYSDYYKAAGTADLIADWNGVPTVLDLKTSRKLKQRDFYEGYFVQATAYALMLNEILGNNLFIRQVVILMLPDDGMPQIWENSIGDNAAKVYDIFVRDQRLNKR